MLKAGIFIDSENLSRNGGGSLRYDVIRKLVEAQGAIVLRANAYLAIDELRESRDPQFRSGKENYRNAIRRSGFHLVLKEARRYVNDDGQEVVKANADIDLAVDALLQAENLDYILLGTGDGDFLRLVRALQAKGKRVDLLAFDNVNVKLRKEADFHFCGFLVPGLIQQEENRSIGIIHHIDADRGYGFVTVREGLALSDLRTDIFLHINDLQSEGRPMNMARFIDMKSRENLVEFELQEQPNGRVRAINAKPFGE